MNWIKCCRECQREDITSIVRRLIEHGAEVDAIGPNGGALRRASDAGHEEIVKILIENGTDVNAESWPHGSAPQKASTAYCRQLPQGA